MGLENPNFVDDLVETNPVGLQDFRSEGDDHLRGIKRAVKNTFPGMKGRAWRKRSMAASGPLTIDDNMVMVKAAGGITITPSAAATMGNGFISMIRADAGDVTVDPTENINGAASLVIPNGYTAIITCDGGEYYAMLVFHAVPPTAPPFESGTAMVFHQTAAPSGWTKLLNSQYDNTALRTTTGVAGTGGADNFTTTFGPAKTTAGHGLTEAQNGPHSHTATANNFSVGSGTDGLSGLISGKNDINVAASITIGISGAGALHSHGLPNFNLKYVDVIVATRN